MQDHFGNYITDEEVESSGIPKNNITARIHLGWSKERALNTPVKKYYKPSKAEKKLLEKYKISRAVFHDRLRRGWAFEQAVNTPLFTNEESLKKARRLKGREDLNVNNRHFK